MKTFTLFRKFVSEEGKARWQHAGIYQAKTRHDAVEGFARDNNIDTRTVEFRYATGHPLTSYYHVAGRTIEVAVQATTAKDHVMLNRVV